MNEPVIDRVTVLERSITALTLLLPLHAMQSRVAEGQQTPCLIALQRLLSSFTEDERWIAVLADWWCAALHGAEIDRSRWTVAQDPVLANIPEIRKIVAATSSIGEVPALERVMAKHGWQDELTEARRLLVYREHGQLDTETELQTFHTLVAPLEEYAATVGSEFPPEPVPAFPDAKQIASHARTHRLQHNSPRYLIMERRLRAVWEQFESAIHVLRSAAPWAPASAEISFEEFAQIDLVRLLADAASSIAGATEFLTWLSVHLPTAEVSDPTELVEVAAIQTVEETSQVWDDLGNQQRVDAWLILDVEAWMGESEVPPTLAAWGSRYHQLLNDVAMWRATPADSADELDEIEYALIAGDLDGGERQLSNVRMQRAEAERLRDRLQSRRNQALDDFAQFDNPPDELAKLAGVLQAQTAAEIDEARLTEFSQGMARLSQRRRDLLQQRLEEIRDQTAAQTDIQLQRLSTLGPKSSVRTGAEILAREAIEVQTASQAEDALAKLTEYVDDHFDEARKSAESAIASLRAAGEESVGGLDTEAEADILQMLSTLEFQQPADALRQAVEALERFRRRRPIDSWRADRDGEVFLVNRVSSYVRERMTLSEQDVRRFHVAIKTKPFVILAGLSGSGKSSIARLYSEAIGVTAASGRLRRIAVQPSWVDGTETIGYFNPIIERFQPGWLTEILISCEQEPDLPHVVILDEMNLAPVEHYLADVLSAMEDRRGGGDAMIRIYARDQTVPYIEHQVPFPPNLFIIGTINTDETTRPLSERVLDRANVVQLELSTDDGHHRPARAGTLAKPLLVTMSEWRKISEETPAAGVHDELVVLAQTLARAGVGLGLRTHVEIERFLANSKGVLSAEEAVDAALLQRVIPKLRGFKRALAPSLDELSEAFERLGAMSCQFVIDQWRKDTVDLDAFLDGSDQSIGLLLSTRLRNSRTAVAGSGQLAAGPANTAAGGPLQQLSGQPTSDDLQRFVAELLTSPEYQVNGLVLGPKIGQAVHSRWPDFNGATGWLRDLQKPLGFKLATPMAQKDSASSKTDPQDVAVPEPQPEGTAVPMPAVASLIQPTTPTEYCTQLRATFVTAGWRNNVLRLPAGITLTAAQQWLALNLPRCDYRAVGFPKFKFAMQVACADTDFCLDEGGTGSAELHIQLRSRAVQPLAGISLSQLGSVEVAREIVRLTSLGMPFPSKENFDLALTWVLGDRRTGLVVHIDELLAQDVGAPIDAVRPAVRFLMRAGVLVSEGSGTQTSVHVNEEVHGRAVAVQRCRSVVQECLQSVPWTFDEGVLDELLPSA